jgi:hypothetical protein
MRDGGGDNDYIFDWAAPKIIYRVAEKTNLIMTQWRTDDNAWTISELTLTANLTHSQSENVIF